jgi:hypothetical protein
MRYSTCHNHDTLKEEKELRPYLVLATNINRLLYKEIREFLYTKEILVSEGIFGTFDYSNDDEDQRKSDLPQYLRSQGEDTHKLVKNIGLSLIQHPSGHYKPRFATLDQLLLTTTWMKENLSSLETTHLFIFIGHRGGRVDSSLLVLALRLLERLPGWRIVHIYARRRWQRQIRGTMKDETDKQGIEVISGCDCPLWEKFMCTEICCDGLSVAFGEY